MTDAQEWLDNQEGQQVPTAAGRENAYCDTCADPIRPGDDCQLYYASHTFDSGGHVDLDEMATMAMYGECHHRPRLMLPHEGTNELLLEATIDTDGKLWEFSVVDSSPESKGIPWDPDETMMTLFHYPIEAWAGDQGTFIAPGDVADLIFVIGLDPRDVIDLDDGSITAGEEKQREARRLLRQFSENSLKSGTAEKVQRKGDRQDEWMAEQVGVDVETIKEEGVYVYYSADEGEYVAEKDGERIGDGAEVGR